MTPAALKRAKARDRQHLTVIQEDEELLESRIEDNFVGYRMFAKDRDVQNIMQQRDMPAYKNPITSDGRSSRFSSGNGGHGGQSADDVKADYPISSAEVKMKQD